MKSIIYTMSRGGRSLGLLCFAACMPVNSWANEWLYFDAGAEFRYENAMEKEQQSKDGLHLAVEFTAEAEDLFVLTMGADGRYDFVKKIDRKNKERSKVTDFYADFELGPTSWRLGKQQIAWGVVDGLRVLDRISPLDFHEFNLPAEKERRQHQWLFNLQGDINDSSWQLLWSPLPKVHRLPDPEDLFAFRAPRLRYGADIDTPAPRIVDDTPDSNLLAGRWTHYFNRFELTAAAIYGPDHEPVGSIETTSENARKLVRHYEDIAIVGASVSADVNDIILRGEFAYSPDKSLNFRDGNGLHIDEFQHMKFAAGLEANTFWDLWLNLQYLLDHVANAEKNMVRPETDHFYTLTIRRNFLNETLSTELKTILSNHDDGQIQFAVKYEATDYLFVRMGADIFFGDDETLFGQYNERDRIIAGLTLHF